MLSILLIVGVTLQTAGTYLIWPSRWNIPAHTSLGLLFVAYIIPLAITPTLDKFSYDIVSQYVMIQFLGGILYATGLLIGGNYKAVRLKKTVSYLRNNRKFLNEVLPQRIIILGLAGLLGIWVSFAIMGFIPMFADEPFSAKFFKGQYQESYQRIAWLYRFSFQIILLIFTMVAALWWDKKKHIALVISVCTVLTLTAALTRGSAFIGLVSVIGLVWASKNKFFFLYPIGCVFVTIIGSLSYLIVALLIDNSAFSAIYGTESITESISNGAPDISDQLMLLTSFEVDPKFTFGRTILGGLVPFNFQWNPSVWTLSVSNDTDDISEIASGGFRLSTPLWGYFNFGWTGVCLGSSLIGFFVGAFLNSIKKEFSENSILFSAFCLFIYNNIIGIISNGMTLSIYSAPSVFVLFFLIYRSSAKISFR
ncbi:hypothetical protein [Nevskia ramosa]|uniref:hypothetical protein n=1 Tax=Nevskia ramosa TaxID=64002 RepID=UPI00146E7077|nr:hypothetical protein [Nevskia ramosa]